MTATLTNTALVSGLNALARARLRAGLALLPEAHQNTFKMMYWPEGGYKRFEDNPKDMDLDRIIDGMPLSKLDWALTQTENSLKKLGIAVPTGKWTPASAIRAANAAGFTGQLWVMSPEDLALLLNRVQYGEA